VIVFPSAVPAFGTKDLALVLILLQTNACLPSAFEFRSLGCGVSFH
jgi:hypothetical protein